MSIFIINRSQPSKTPYSKWLNDLKGEVLVYTKPEYYSDFKDFSKVRTYENFEKNQQLYLDLIDDININEENYLISTNEFDLVQAGIVRDKFKIKGQNTISATYFRNKVKMKEMLKDITRVPNFSAVNNIYDIYDFIKKNGYPVVVKPFDGAASQGVSIIRNNVELDELATKGLNDNLEVEEYIEGEMYHVDGLYHEGEVFISYPSKYINGCLAFQKNKFLASYLLTPNSEMFEQLNITCKKVLDCLPTPDSVTAFHAEFFVTNDNEIVFCEIASRVGGGRVVETLENSTGLNILKEWILSQAGIKFNSRFIENFKHSGWILVPPQEGKLKEIQKVLPYEWIKSIDIKPDILGKDFKGAQSSIDYIAAVVVEGDDEEQVQNRLNKVNEWFIENSIWEKEAE